VPVFIYLNPHFDGAWYSNDPSYADVLQACRDYADVIYDWSFPSGFFHTAAPIDKESRPLPNGDTEHIMHTPSGAITSISRSDWRGVRKIKRWITEPEDVERILSIPYVPARPAVSLILKARAHGKEFWVTQATFPDPICIAGMVDEMVMAIWTIEHRDLIRRMLDVALERILGELEYPNNHTIFHRHGKVGQFLEDFAAIGTDGLNVLEPPPIGDTDLADAKDRIGDRVCLIGNIQYDDIARGTQEDIERLVVKAIEQGAPRGGFILSPCAYPYERPLPEKASRNIIHYLKMGHKYGRYPLSLRSQQFSF
jgi:hypothetical protein